MATSRKDFYSLYEMEALAYDKKRQESFWVILLKASGIFVLITGIVFCIANYQFIKSQVLDRSARRKQENDYSKDSDGDGIPNWWGAEYSLQATGRKMAFLDDDSDGANNLTEYLYNTSPLDPDTDRDGYFDGEEIEEGYNPNGIGRLDSDNDGIYDWYEQQYGLDKDSKEDAKQDPDKDGLDNASEFLHQTDPRNQDSDNDSIIDSEEVKLGTNPMGQGVAVARAIDPMSQDSDGDKLSDFFEQLYGTDSANKDTDQDGFDDYRELVRGYDPTGDGMLIAQVSIPSIGVKAPVVWSQKEEESAIKTDLENGIIRYPQTAFPGMRGNTFITGHSSYYAWSKSPYKEVLKDIDKVKTGDKIIIEVALKNSRTVNITYTAKSSEIVKPDDPQLFRDFEGYEMTLVSCWPKGTDWKRMMIKADLQSPKPQ